MGKELIRRWKVTQSQHGVGLYCPGVGIYWTVIKFGRSARIHRFLANLFNVSPGHPRYEKFVRGWTVSLEGKFGDQEKLYGGIKYLTFFEKPDRPGVALEFTRKIPPMVLLDDLKKELLQEDPKPKPKPKPKRKRKSRKKSPAKAGAKAADVVAKSEQPEGDNASTDAGESP